MTKEKITRITCDECGKTYTIHEGNEGFPYKYGWNYIYNLDIKTMRNDEVVNVKQDDKHFCSNQCLTRYMERLVGMNKFTQVHEHLQQELRPNLLQEGLRPNVVNEESRPNPSQEELRVAQEKYERDNKPRISSPFDEPNDNKGQIVEPPEEPKKRSYTGFFGRR